MVVLFSFVLRFIACLSFVLVKLALLMLYILGLIERMRKCWQKKEEGDC